MFQTIKNAWRIKDLREKIIYTFIILLIFRIGSHIPVPFVDAEQIRMFMTATSDAGNPFGYLNLMMGGGLSEATLFALGISPYITSSIIIQLLTIAIPALERLSDEGPDGQKKLSLITRYTALALAVLQSIAYYILNRNQGGITETGAFPTIVIVATFAAGAMLVMWLGEQIDKKGIGNGISMILFAGIVARAPVTVRYLITEYLIGQGGRYYVLVPLVFVAFIFMVFAVVIMTNAERRIPVRYAKRVVGRKMYGGQSSYMPIKVTMTGVMPVIFASSILSMPAMIKLFVDPLEERGIGKFLGFFDSTRWPYIILYIVLILAFNYFYVAVQYDPMEMANNLRQNSGQIPGIRPGEPTAEFIRKVTNKVTLVGAIFIAAICVIPILSAKFGGMPIQLGGTSLVIVVGVALDTVQELESQMMLRHHRGFL